MQNYRPLSMVSLVPLSGIPLHYQNKIVYLKGFDYEVVIQRLGITSLPDREKFQFV